MAAASIAAPTAKVKDPMAIDLGRPKLSERLPAKRDASVAGGSTEDTTKPSKDGDTSPKLFAKDGIAVTGPIVLVSSLSEKDPVSYHARLEAVLLLQLRFNVQLMLIQAMTLKTYLQHQVALLETFPST